MGRLSRVALRVVEKAVLHSYTKKIARITRCALEQIWLQPQTYPIGRSIFFDVDIARPKRRSTGERSEFKQEEQSNEAVANCRVVTRRREPGSLLMWTPKK